MNNIQKAFENRKKLGLRSSSFDPEQGEVYHIDGPGDGSGVDDNVDVNVHGKKIKVSKNERFAVFPASIPAEEIEEFIESKTGRPTATSGGGLRDGMRAFGGAVDNRKVVLRDTPHLQGGATNDAPDEYVNAPNGVNAVNDQSPVQRVRVNRAAPLPNFVKDPSYVSRAQAAKEPGEATVPEAIFNDVKFVEGAAKTTKPKVELPTSDPSYDRKQFARPTFSSGAVKVNTPQEDAVKSSWALRDTLTKENTQGGFDGGMNGSIRGLARDAGLRKQFNDNQALTAKVPGNSGVITASTDANGRLVLSGKDVKGSVGLSGYDMKNDIESMKRANAIRQSMIDGQRTDIDQGVYKATGDAGLAQAVKEGRMSGGQAVQLYQQAEQNKSLVGMRQAMAEHQKGQLDLQGRQLDEMIRRNDLADKAQAAKAKELREQKNIADLDNLIAESGFEGAEAKAFRDFMRQNFFGRKHMINGKEVDVPGMEDMSADQMRALMPEAIMRHKLNRDFNKASRNGTSLNEAKGLRRREIGWQDVARGPTGMPDWLSTDSPGKVPVFGKGSWVEAATPDIFRNINRGVLEEVMPNGEVGRVALARDIEKDKEASLDRARRMRELGVK